MKEIITIARFGKTRIFIRNRWTLAFQDTWHLINIERCWLRGRNEYKFCLIGFELVILQRK